MEKRDEDLPKLNAILSKKLKVGKKFITPMYVSVGGWVGG